MGLVHPEWLVSTEWLAEHLEDSELVIFDATVHLDPSLQEDRHPRRDWEAAHIPGAAFLDHAADLSDPTVKVPYTRLEPDALARAFAGAGVSDSSHVVIYSAGHVMWATRVLWLLRGIGFDRAAVLDGGFAKWQAEGRHVESGARSHAAGSLEARPRPEVWAHRVDVKAAIGSGSVCTINALPRTLHSGEAKHHYGRPGHITGSENVPFTIVVDRESGCFTDPTAWRLAFEASGAFERARAVTYCGGGISATLAAFALVQLGHPWVSVYDGSLAEWSGRPELPMETG